MINRRNFLTAAGSGALVSRAWPALAQQAAGLPLVAFVGNVPPRGWERYINEFRRGMAEAGFAHGRNMTLEFHWAEGKYDRLPSMIAGLLQRRVAILAPLGTPGIVAAQKATKAIPIVFIFGGDPVRQGFVGSYRRPGGNITGVTALNTEIAAKRIGLIRELLPGARSMAFLTNPANVLSNGQLQDTAVAAKKFGIAMHEVRARSSAEMPRAFEIAVETGSDALIVGTDTFLFSLSSRIAELSREHKLPAISPVRAFPFAGGLMSYGVDMNATFRQQGRYVATVLHGANPAEIPVFQASKFELVINMKTALTLGLSVPASLLVRSDEVIE